MPRRRLVIGNWKMNLLHPEAVALVEQLVAGLGSVPGLGERIHVGVAPSPPFVQAVATARGDAKLELVAQDCHAETGGAFTGDSAAVQLASVGVQRVIVGHSERRNGHGESSELVGRKLAAVFDAGLHAVLCVGERLEQRRAGQEVAVVQEQLEGAFAPWQGAPGAELLARLVLAYEPVWAIGTGEVATPEQAGAMHRELRAWLDAKGGADVPILYGGSVKPGNIQALASTPAIDGALVGGASLNADSFLAIARAVAETRD